MFNMMRRNIHKRRKANENDHKMFYFIPVNFIFFCNICYCDTWSKNVKQLLMW